MGEMSTYTGGCHCGAVRYEVSANLSKVIACNCSICAKRGMILTFVPVQQFTLLSDPQNLTDYQFNKKVVHHLFCPVCGVQSFAKGVMPDGTEMVAINVRCLDEVDVGALSPAPFDGKSL
jgi:hypothetical protein